MAVPVWEFADGKWQVVQTTIPVLDVHELLAYTYHQLKLRCPKEKVQEYWQHLKSVNMPFAASHPGSSEHVPFSLYGDECCLGDPKDKVTAMFLTLTLFRPKRVRLGHFLLFAMKDQDMVHEGLATMGPILEHLVWSSNLAFGGRWPSCDASGKDLPAAKARLAGQWLADGTRFACCELKGDWKWHERVLRLRHTPVSMKCCFQCDAVADDSSPNKYYDTPDAHDARNPGWVSTEVTTSQFITQKLRPGTLSPLHCTCVSE